MRKWLVACLCVLAAASARSAQEKPAPAFDSAFIGDLRARAIGPAVMSGRIAALDVVAGDPRIIYAGSAGGGLWKSVNAGLTFAPVFAVTTVAIATTAGLLLPAVVALDLGTVNTALVAVAIGYGGLGLSHVNDSGFWLVSRFFGMDEKTTLKTWTVMETTLGVTAFAVASLLWPVASAMG